MEIKEEQKIQTTKEGEIEKTKKTKYRSTKYRKRSEGAESQRQTDGRNLKENHEKTY